MRSSTKRSVPPRTDFLWRHEIKYLVPQYVRTALTSDMRAFASADPHAPASGYYTVRSLYLDSPDWKCFYEKADGQTRRFKLRVRKYVENDRSSLLKFEIKYKHGTHIGKLVAAVQAESHDGLLAALNRRTYSLSDDAPDALREFFALKQRYAMCPILNVQFRRQAFFDRVHRGVRITFDDRVIARPSRDIFESMSGARPALLGNQSILEVKAHGMVPYWFQFLVRKYRLHAEPVSKYQRAAQALPFGLESVL